MHPGDYSISQLKNLFEKRNATSIVDKVFQKVTNQLLPPLAASSSAYTQPKRARSFARMTCAAAPLWRAAATLQQTLNNSLFFSRTAPLRRRTFFICDASKQLDYYEKKGELFERRVFVCVYSIILRLRLILSLRSQKMSWGLDLFVIHWKVHRL